MKSVEILEERSLKLSEKKHKTLRESVGSTETLGMPQIEILRLRGMYVLGAEGNLPGIPRGRFPFLISRPLLFAARSFSPPKTHSVLCLDSASVWVWPAAEAEDPRSAE